MRTNHSLSFYGIALLFLGFINVSAQKCPDDKYIEKAIKQSATKQLVQTFPLDIKSKKDIKGKDLLFNMTLTKGITYQFYLANGEDNQMEDMYINLFDKNENMLCTTYNDFTGSYSNKLVFKCRTTGNYILSYYPQTKKYCGVIVLGITSTPGGTAKK